MALTGKPWYKNYMGSVISGTCQFLNCGLSSEALVETMKIEENWRKLADASLLFLLQTASLHRLKGSTQSFSVAESRLGGMQG